MFCLFFLLNNMSIWWVCFVHMKLLDIFDDLLFPGGSDYSRHLFPSSSPLLVKAEFVIRRDTLFCCQNLLSLLS